MPAPSIDFLIGQVVMADFGGTEPPESLRRLIAQRALGGVILFQKNIESRAQVARLCADLQTIAREAGVPPLVIAIDQEGGPVERLPLGFPSAMALGATGSSELARRAGRAVGRALRSVGISVDFAPVLDVNSNPDNPVIGIRSFGEDPDLVARLGAAWIDGLQDSGVAAAGKHFPGHGDADLDSHETLPIVDHRTDRLNSVELLPFRRAVQGGVVGLMTAHVAFPHLQDGEIAPATVAPAIIQGLLRERWGFDGVVFTDSLLMKPIHDGIGVGDGAARALRAGADVLLACGGPEVQEEVIAAVRRAVERGTLSRARLEESALRVQTLRTRWRPAEAGVPGEEETKAAEAEERSLAHAIAEEAVTLVRDEARLLPLPPGPVHVVTFASSDPAAPTLGSELRRLGREVHEVTLSVNGEVGSERSGADAFQGSEPLILVTHSRGRPDPRQMEIVRRALGAPDRRLGVVAAGTPYDLAQIPDVATFLATYGRERVMVEAAARMLAGEIRPRGRLPVSIPGCYPVGHGIT